jgi:hypothetical protein
VGLRQWVLKRERTCYRGWTYWSRFRLQKEEGKLNSEKNPVREGTFAYGVSLRAEPLGGTGTELR